jgi:hypothetical protein
MAALGDYVLTLVDWAKRLDPTGSTADVVELLSQTNEILTDMLFVEGNLPTGHRTTVRTGLPDVTWRKLNYGVQPSKSVTAQVDDTCGIAETWSQIDAEIAALNGNDSQFLLSEQIPFIEAMNQEMAGGLFYFDTDTDPEKFLGLAGRYAALATQNVVTAGGAGSDLTSMWLIGWSPNTVHGVFPKGSRAGVFQDYQGVQRVSDSQTPPGYYMAHLTHWQWKLGLCVRDWRYVVRICNIETTGTSAIIDPDLLVDAYYKLPSLSIPGGKFAFYCNSTVMSQLSKLAMNKSNAHFTVGQEFGKPVVQFWGIPIRRVDQILNTETALT